MTKKKLSDLLREEAGKDAEVVESVADAPDDQSAAEVDVMEPPMALSRMTKAQLLEYVQGLREALGEAREKVTTFEDRVSRLERQGHEREEGLAQELDKVKADALGLAQENKKLQAQVLTMQKDAEVPQRQQPERGKPEATPRRGQMVRRVPVPRPPARSILERPIRPKPIPRKSVKRSKSFDTWCYD